MNGHLFPDEATSSGRLWEWVGSDNKTLHFICGRCLKRKKEARR
jgi:hypothetical protein